jgi:hypothetical protein
MRTFIIIYFVILVISCKKENEELVTTIEGTVINTGSKEPIDSVMVVAVDGVSNYDPFFGSSDNPGTGKYVIKYTDKYGKFKLSIKGNYPCIFLEKTGYEFVVFTQGSSDNYKSYTAGQIYKDEVLELWAEAFFKPIFIKLDCTPFDSIYIDEGNSIPVGFQKTTFLFKGCDPIDRWPAKAALGIGDKYFHYWIKFQTHSIWNEKIDSVFIKSFTTFNDTIYF